MHIEVGGSGPRRLVGDAGKLRQIFVNLLSNALKFTLSGHITLRLRVEPAGDSRVQLTGEVQDTGPGIDPADLPSVFDAFEQGGLGRRSGAGTGLGLPISREFARMMQGDITVVSAPGEGSVFRLDACLAAADPGHGPAADRPTILADQAVRLAAGQPEQRVLVVDDQKDSRQFLLELLTGAGFAVREADDGERAVELCGRWRPHAVLMDVRMPGMDGLTAIREIRRQDRERRIKIISLTASVFAEDREGVLAAGADSFLLKPVRIADVLHELGGLLSLRFVQTGIGAGAETPDGSIGLLETLPAIAPELAERLRISVAAADLDQILATIAELQPEAPAVAARLERMANHFDYDGLLRAVAALARPPV